MGQFLTEEKNEKRYNKIFTIKTSSCKRGEEFNKFAGMGKQKGLNCRDESSTQMPPRNGSKALAGPCWGAGDDHTKGFPQTQWRNICHRQFKLGHPE